MRPLTQKKNYYYYYYYLYSKKIGEQKYLFMKTDFKCDLNFLKTFSILK